MYYNDHAPPHFHARYGEHHVMVDMESLGVLEGSLPPRVMGLVTEWSSLHRTELMQNWRLARQNRPLDSIEPLE